MNGSRSIFTVIVCVFIFATGMLFGENLQVSIANLEHGSRIPDCEDFLIKLNASVENGTVKQIIVYANTRQIERVKNEPWEVTWTNIVTGYYTLWAKAKDNEGNEVFSDTIGVVAGDVSDGNLIYNSYFNCSTANWSLQNNDTGRGELSWIENAGISEGGAAFIDIINPGTSDWHIQFLHTFPLDSGHTYELYFIADAPQEKIISYAYQETSGDYTYYGGGQITVDGNGFFGPIEFTPDINDRNVSFRFYLGNSTVPIYFDDIMIIDPSVHYPDEPVGVKEKLDLPRNFAMIGNYPNPFNSTTVIQYSVPAASDVILEILNVRGETVKTLIDTHHLAGLYKVQWDGTDRYGTNLSSGSYIARLKINNPQKSQTLTTKLLLVE